MRRGAIRVSGGFRGRRIATSTHPSFDNVSIEINDKQAEVSEHGIFIDGTYLMYRNYHAMPPLHNKNKEPVHAVLAFTKEILRLYQKWPNASWFAVVFGVLLPDPVSTRNCHPSS